MPKIILLHSYWTLSNWELVLCYCSTQIPITHVLMWLYTLVIQHWQVMVSPSHAEMELKSVSVLCSVNDLLIFEMSMFFVLAWFATHVWLAGCNIFGKISIDIGKSNFRLLVVAPLYWLYVILGKILLCFSHVQPWHVSSNSSTIQVLWMYTRCVRLPNTLYSIIKTSQP